MHIVVKSLSISKAIKAKSREKLCHLSPNNNERKINRPMEAFLHHLTPSPLFPFSTIHLRYCLFLLLFFFNCMMMMMTKMFKCNEMIIFYRTSTYSKWFQDIGKERRHWEMGKGRETHVEEQVNCCYLFSQELPFAIIIALTHRAQTK